jgi:O-antigen/teichoic acid export membrane protein
MWDELKNVLKHTTIYGVGSILSKVVGFLLIPFYTHYLRPSQYGTLELLDLSMSFLGLLVSVWVTIPLVRFYYDSDNESERNKIVSTTFYAVAIIAAILASAGFVFSKHLSWLILKSPEFGLYIRVISVSFFLSCLNSVAWNYMRAKLRSSLIVSLDIASLVLLVSLNVYFVAFLHLGVLGILYSGMLGHALNTSVLLGKMLREVGLQFELAKLTKVAIFGAPLIFTNLAAFTINFSDRFFLEHFSTMSVVGIYALGYKFGYMLSFLLIQPFYMIWSARMYEIAKRKDGPEIFSRFGAYFSLILAAAALGLALPIREVIRVISAQDFHAASRIVPIVALAYIFQGLMYYFQTGILIQKKSSYLGVMGLAGAATDLLLNFLLIPRYSAMGAAWATVSSFFVMSLLAYVFSQRVYPIPYRLSQLGTPIVTAAVLYYAASEWLRISSPLLSACVKVAVFLPLFLAAVYLLDFFDKREVDKLKSLLEGLRARGRSTAAVLPER